MSTLCHPPSMRREHVGSFTVTGAFSLVLQINGKNHGEHLNPFMERLSQDQAPALQKDEQCQKHNQQVDRLVAHIGLTSGGFAKSVELYGDYVARQIGVHKHSRVAKQVADLAMGYLSGDKSPSDQSLDNILAFLNRRVQEHLSCSRQKKVFEELIKELDACMISYFSFHWEHSAHLLDQVRSGQRNLRSIVMAATRKHRLQRAMEALKTKRAFTTLLETLKAMKNKHANGEPVAGLRDLNNVKKRNPVLLLVGGGMGAGKSTVVKEILHGTESPVRCDAVVVEADAFKETDVLYRALSSGSGDVTMASQLVHDSSTQAASSLLVSALNEGRDVVFDGTMSWEPFVTQTIAMARDIHRRRYRLGPGYKHDMNGVLVERYWEPVEAEECNIENEFLASLESEASASTSAASQVDEEKVVNGSSGCQHEFRPAYKIILVGVTCDALLAVVRGIRRAIITNRFVPIPAQLRSHKMFASALERYCELVDSARIYSTSKMGAPPELVGVKDGPKQLNKLNLEAFETLQDLALLNPDARSALELYDGKTSKVWTEIALAGNRTERQEFLRNALEERDDDFDSSSSGFSSPSDETSSVYSSSTLSSTDSLTGLEEMESFGSRYRSGLNLTPAGQSSTETGEEFVRDD